MIESLVRMRKEPLKTMKVEDIKIEFVDVCVVPTADAYSIFDFESDSSGSPSTPAGTPASEDGSLGSSAASGTSEPTSKPRKRAKLDHMSAEEKAQHRKMMNRISAQSARDRQKAHMMRQDLTIKNLQAANEAFKAKNQELTTANEELETKNQVLKEENERLISAVSKLEAKLKAAAGVTSASACSASHYPSAEGIGRTTSEIDVYSDSLVDALSWNDQGREEEEPGISDKATDRNQSLSGIDRFHSAVAETIATQMADQKWSSGSDKNEVWIGEQRSFLERHLTSGSSAPKTVSNPPTSKLASLLTAPLVVKPDIVSTNLLGTLLSLPIKEPATLKLPSLNLGVSQTTMTNNNNGAILSRIADSTTDTNSDSNNIYNFKQPPFLLHDEEDKNHYLNEADLYDSWKSTACDLFPELYP